MKRQIIEIRVYWDATDPNDEGWVYKAYDHDVLITAGCIDGVDLKGAIAEAIHRLGLGLTADQFASEPRVDGGFAIWTAE